MYAHMYVYIKIYTCAGALWPYMSIAICQASIHAGIHAFVHA